MNKNEEPTVWVGLGTTINIGNFENYKIDIGMANVPIDISEEDLNKRIVLAKDKLYKITMSLADELGKRIQDVKSQ